MGDGGSARVSDFFFKESKSKKMFEFVFWWGEGSGGGVDGLTDEQAQNYLPLQLFHSWGHNTALMYQLCP